MSSKLAESFQLAGVPFEGSILLFGGYGYSKVTTRLSYEGEVIEDHSKSALIPQYTCERPFASQDGKVYAVGSRKIN